MKLCQFKGSTSKLKRQNGCVLGLSKAIPWIYQTLILRKLLQIKQKYNMKPSVQQSISSSVYTHFNTSWCRQGTNASQFD